MLDSTVLLISAELISCLASSVSSGAMWRSSQSLANSSTCFFHAQDPIAATSLGTTGYKRPWRDFQLLLEMALEEMGPEFGCVGLRNAGQSKKLLRTGSPSSSHRSSSCKRSTSCLEPTRCRRERNWMMAKRVASTIHGTCGQRRRERTYCGGSKGEAAWFTAACGER